MSPPTSLSFKGQVTKQANVEWSIPPEGQNPFFTCYCCKALAKIKKLIGIIHRKGLLGWQLTPT